MDKSNGWINDSRTILLGTVAGCLLTAPAAESRESSGYYVKLGFGVGGTSDTYFDDLDCNSMTSEGKPSGLYGCGIGRGDIPTRSVGDFGSGLTGKLGFGTRLGQNARIEFLTEYRPSLTFEGQANFKWAGESQPITASVDSVSAMIAGYVDVPPEGSSETSSMPTFYFGAGVGVARNSIDMSEIVFNRTKTQVPAGTSTDSAYMLEAGIAFEQDENTTVEIGLTYVNLGNVVTGAGDGFIVWKDGSQGPNPLELTETSASLKATGIGISLRYDF